MPTIHLRHKPVINNSYFNPPPREISYRVNQLVQYANQEIRYFVTVRNISRVKNSLAVIGSYRRKTFLQIGPSFWIEIPKLMAENLTENLQRKVVEFFCSTLD